MDDTAQYQFALVKQRREDRHEIEYELILRQQPKQSRMCGIGEKADRRPIDPPPIIQLKVFDKKQPRTEKSSFLQNPYFFMYASLVAPDSDEELHLLRDKKTRSTTGSTVSSLYHLKDIDNSDAGFFVFPDLSVRMEGTYRLKLSLFEIINREVYHCKSIYSDIFTVYSAKRFPGMEESTFLSRSFADQGLKIRIRKEIRVRRRLQKRKTTDAQGESTKKRSRADDDDRNSSDTTEGRDDRAISEKSVSSSYDKSFTPTKDSMSRSPTIARPRHPYSHYDHMYPGYPQPRPPMQWSDRPEYIGDYHSYPHPYAVPYDRRYVYPPYAYYPHPPPMHDLPDHRYAYPPPPEYSRPPPAPIYPSQQGYYESMTPHRLTSSESPSRPYSYDSPSPYTTPQRTSPWSHYGDRPPTRDHTMDPAYRSPAITHPARSGMYGYPTEYYPPPYPPHPHIPAAPKGDYPPEANIDPVLNPHVVANQKMPAISDLLSPEHQSQVNSERGASVAPSSRPYQPPTGFSHGYSPIRPQPYPPVYTRPQHEQYAHHPYPIAKSQPTPPQPSPTTEDPTRLPPMSVPSREATSTSPTHPPSAAAARSEDRTPDYGYDQQRRQAYPVAGQEYEQRVNNAYSVPGTTHQQQRQMIQPSPSPTTSRPTFQLSPTNQSTPSHNDTHSPRPTPSPPTPVDDGCVIRTHIEDLRNTTQNDNGKGDSHRYSFDNKR